MRHGGTLKLELLQKKKDKLVVLIGELIPLFSMQWKVLLMINTHTHMQISIHVLRWCGLKKKTKMARALKKKQQKDSSILSDCAIEKDKLKTENEDFVFAISAMN